MKILIAGLGSAGQRHARNLRTLLGDDLVLTAFRVRRTSPVIGPDLSTDDARSIEDAYGIRSFESLDDALADGPDAVVVANPNTFHVPVALAAARAGAHVFVEKPLGHSLDGVDELASAVEEQGVVCQVGFQLRFHPALARLRAELPQIAPLLSARIDLGENLADMHPYEDYRLLNYGRADQGGGVILMQSHDLDLAYSLFGMPRSVYAVGCRRSDLEIDVEDTVAMLLDCEDVAVQVTQDFVRRPPARRYEIVGANGTASWDDVAEPVDRNELFLAELRHFLACVAGDEEPAVGVREAEASLRIALAAKRSLASGRPETP